MAGTRKPGGEITARAVAAWESFCEELKGAGGVLAREATPADEQNLAEGVRFLMRMLRAGFENAFEYADPEHPLLGPRAAQLDGALGVYLRARDGQLQRPGVPDELQEAHAAAKNNVVQTYLATYTLERRPSPLRVFLRQNSYAALACKKTQKHFWTEENLGV